MDISEKNFEATIEQAGKRPAHPKGQEAAPGRRVAPGGYRKRKPEDYNRSLCLDPDVVLEFVYATQPREWEKLKAQHAADVKASSCNAWRRRLSSGAPWTCCARA